MEARTGQPPPHASAGTNRLQPATRTQEDEIGKRQSEQIKNTTRTDPNKERTTDPTQNAANNKDGRSNTYATENEQQTMEISIKKLIAKYNKCITNMNRILTNEPSGSKELAVEFNLIDPNANALENSLSEIETEASHSKYKNQQTVALVMLRTLQTKAAEVHETCRKAVRDIHAATGPEAYR